MIEQRDPEVSLAAYAAASVGNPQPVWRTLDVIRESGFTGEVTFQCAPQVTAYADGGTIYFAERSDDPAIGQRLLDADVITLQQLERGRVRVGDVEHLGRMFDRDATIDRDAVMVVVESATEELVEELAASVAAPISISAYRHHPSGVHRWFVAPIEPATRRPVSGVNQVDRSVVEELPDVTTPSAEVRIEWNQPTSDSGPASAAPAGHDAPVATEPIDFGDIDIEAELDRFDADSADWISGAGGPSDDDAGQEGWLRDFQIVWPDGTEEPAVESDGSGPAPRTAARLEPPTATALSEPPATSPAAPPVASPPPAPASRSSAPEPLAPPSGLPTPPSGDAPLPPPAALAAPAPGAPRPETGPDGAPGLAMPRIVIEGDPTPDGHVPEDVADAVRRALQAIENAATATASLPQIDLSPITLPDLTLPKFADEEEPLPGPAEVVSPEQAAASIEAVASIEPLRPPQRPVASGFAPPSPDVRAEVLYARAAAAATAVDAPQPLEVAEGVDAHVEATTEPTPEPGRATVVFVDEHDDSGSSRRGALRRLIGSLRKHD